MAKTARSFRSDVEEILGRSRTTGLATVIRKWYTAFDAVLQCALLMRGASGADYQKRLVSLQALVVQLRTTVGSAPNSSASGWYAQHLWTDSGDEMWRENFSQYDCGICEPFSLLEPVIRALCGLVDTTGIQGSQPAYEKFHLDLTNALREFYDALSRARDLSIHPAISEQIGHTAAPL